MAPPPVTVYVTSLTSAPKVRRHIELLHRSLRGLEIPYESFDLVNDEDAKRRWQRAKPLGMVVGLPGYLVGGEWVGTMEEFEEAVEGQYLESFLKQDVDIGADTSKTIGEAELDRLMREMTEDDLDQLVGDLSAPPTKAAKDVAADSSNGKGFLETAGAALATAANATAATTAALATKSAAAVGLTEDEPATATKKVASSEAEKDGPAHGEKTLDEVIDATMAAEKKEAEEEKAAASPVKALDTSTKALDTAPAKVEAASPVKTSPTAAKIEAASPVKAVPAASPVSSVPAASSITKDEPASPVKVAAASGAADDGPAPGEKTLDEVIDQTMAKEKKEALDEEAEKKALDAAEVTEEKKSV